MSSKFHSDFIIDWVERCCQHDANATAIIEEESGKALSYGQLQQLYTKLSSLLKTVIQIPNSTPGECAPSTPLISMLTNRSIASIVAILSILHAGAAYVPVDPSFPENRQIHIFTHSRSQMLIVDADNFDYVRKMDINLPPLVVIDKSGNLIEVIGAEIHESITIPRPLPDECLSYVLYTSGSTGKPKGVMVHNKGLVNVVNYFTKTLNMSKTDKILGLTTLCFDISMLEIFMPLTIGATFVIVSSKTQKNPLKIIDVLSLYNITIMQATPTSYEMLLGCGWTGDANIKFLVGGEACRPKILQLTKNGQGLYNVYGPTETTIWSSCYLFPPNTEYDPNVPVPIGEPISLTSFYVVDEQMQIVPDGEEGELIIGGDGVAIGYLHAPDLTEKRFLPNPFGDPGRIYRTGDLVKKLPGIDLFVFARRMDDQVKVNGYRIELGEVEIAMGSHPSVGQIVVLVVKEALVGFVKVRPGIVLNDEMVFFEDLKKHGAKSLPPYMIPKYYKLLEEFPTTANGKLDKLSMAQLPIPMIDRANEVVTQMKPAEEINHAGTFAEVEGQTLSMVQYVSDTIFRATGRAPNASASFAAVGIDSLAAVLFKNVLSQALGGISIDQNVLYDVDTTIESFSIDLFERLLRERPDVLKNLHIDRARDSNDLEEGNYGYSHTPNNKLDSLGRVLLLNRKLMDGYRGIVAILVLLDHFFLTGRVFGIRSHADTLIFIMLTGFTIELQNLADAESTEAIEEQTLTVHAGQYHQSSRNEKKIHKWDWKQFLFTRFIGLFPIYWLTLLICSVRLYIKWNIYRSTETLGHMKLSIVLYVLGLETWSNKINTDMFYGVYYVSLIWGVFLVYAFLYHTYRSNYHWTLKLFLLCCFIGYVIGIVHLGNVGYFHPLFGLIYFTVGFLCARLFNYCRLKFPTLLQEKPLTSVEIRLMNSGYCQVPTTSSTIAAAARRPLVAVKMNRVSEDSSSDVGKDKDEEDRPSAGSNDHNEPENNNTMIQQETNVSVAFMEFWSKFGLAIMIDVLAFVFLFIIFNTKGGDFNPSHTQSRAFFDRFFYLYGLPFIFAMMLVLSLLQPAYPRSLFTMIIAENPLLNMIGECSYAIYLIQKIVVYFWWTYAIDGCRHGVWPFTRQFINHEDHPTVFDKWYVTLSGVIITCILGIFIQKVFQERFIGYIHYRIMSYSLKRKDQLMKAGTSSKLGQPV